MKISKQRVVSVLQALADHASRNICLHEETYRGGTIWEICSLCGERWADDEGGKPTGAHKMPRPITDAFDLLAEIRQPRPPDAGQRNDLMCGTQPRKEEG